MRYPESEPEQIALARGIISGLKEHDTVFPNPPIAPATADAKLVEYETKRALADSLIAQAQIAIQDKDEVLADINDINKTQIEYAERKTNYNDAELKLISWGGRSPRKALQPPSQPAVFEILKQGEGWGFFDWKEPKLGGKAAAYIVRRSEDGVNYTDAGTFTVSEGNVQNQPRGKKLWYQVVAVNRAGESEASNTVVVTF